MVWLGGYVLCYIVSVLFIKIKFDLNINSLTLLSSYIFNYLTKHLIPLFIRTRGSDLNHSSLYCFFEKLNNHVDADVDEEGRGGPPRCRKAGWQEEWNRRSDMEEELKRI